MKGERNDEIRQYGPFCAFQTFALPTERPTNQPTDMTSYRSARTHLKRRWRFVTLYPSLVSLLQVSKTIFLRATQKMSLNDAKQIFRLTGQPTNVRMNKQFSWFFKLKHQHTCVSMSHRRFMTKLLDHYTN